MSNDEQLRAARSKAIADFGKENDGLSLAEIVIGGAMFDAGIAFAAESEQAASVKILREALIALAAKFDCSDNGKCAVCRIGYRLYDLKGNVGICEWPECESHLVRKALAKAALEQEKGE
jgi:hypothetical protein